ncbi:MAG TPA: TRIC cation channel family protein [Planctomycetota bacterium]|nr:TRIC cation channel family protein [Planctomycetota bacterium]
MPEIWFYFDICATFLFAITGALIAARRRYDAVGVAGLAFISATGGGLVRDGVFLQKGPPYVVSTPIYLQVVIAAALLVLLFGKRVQGIRAFNTLIAIVDALALGAYAVVGMNLAIAAGIPAAGAMVVGVTNAIGGGVVRDVIVRREPDVFKPGVPYAFGALFGCALYLLLIRAFSISIPVAMLITVGSVFIFRVLAVYFQIKTKPLDGFDELPPAEP